MSKRESPRHGSMQVWPRKRAKRQYARIRSWSTKEKGLLAFPAYKAGMTHVMAVDTRKNAQTKGETISIPTTILECPPIKIYSIRFYKEDAYGRKVVKEVVVGKDKHLFRKVFTQKTNEAVLKELDVKTFVDVTVTLLTQPGKTGIGKKKPEIFEAGLGGSVEEKFAWAQEHAGKDIAVAEIFKEGEYVDSHAITIGRGFQGPVKRFGIGLKPHKSEKGRRAPGSLGGWSAQQHFMYRVAHAGQTGYHQRTQYNNQVLKIGEKPQDVTPNGGFLHYGVLHNPYILIKGSLQGPKKRMITLTKAIRLYDRSKHSLPTIETISLESKQGR
jgi:large subunit ribosomal protein L3